MIIMGAIIQTDMIKGVGLLSLKMDGIYLAGPIEKPRKKRRLRGFQGFRYATKLF